MERMLETPKGLETEACHAALELDNILKGRPSGTRSLEWLVKYLRAEITPEDSPSAPTWLINPTSAVIIGNAVDQTDVGNGKPLEKVSELQTIIDRLIGMLRQFIESPHEINAHLADGPLLRKFCLALSRSATQVAESTRWRPTHPYRK